MSKRIGTAVALAAVLSTQAGCYTTKVVSQARPEGPFATDRQWFTIGGLVPLSSPAGRECEHGLAYAESKLSGTDWLINVGLTIAGGLIGAAVCGNGVADTQAALAAKSTCATGLGGLVPFLIGSRTVVYSCAEGGDFMPRQGGYRAPPPPPPAEEGAAPAPAPVR